MEKFLRTQLGNTPAVTKSYLYKEDSPVNGVGHQSFAGHGIGSFDDDGIGIFDRAMGWRRWRTSFEE
jgi:hypothetical protein